MGSRTRECPEQVFELFVEIRPPGGDGEEPVILRKYPPDFGQQDVLTEIPKFAFPCKNEILQVEQFVFVLTDIDGMFRYVYCRHGSSANTCLCIMSHLQWFDIFYKMLNFLADIVNSSEENDPTPFLEATFMQDMPMPGVPVTIVAGHHMLNFTVPNPDLLPSIHTSRNLTEYYNAVDANNMMRIFASMLHERRIIITSKKLSRITACIHASEALLYPMHWQHLFIPVLPSHVIDMVTAPMPYLIGVHSSLMQMIESKRMDLGDAVIVDADNNEVKSQYDDLEDLPDDMSSYLKRQLKTQKVQTSMMESGDAISKAFLLALVRLIGGYRDALKFQDCAITFDREAFIQSRTSRSTQAFLHNMLELQIFQQFITGRLELLNDGKGFNDMFEQESIKYADHLNTQSKYKEWMAKKTRKLKITDLKDKVNVQRKKVMSKLREFNDNVKSSQKWRGGEISQQRPAVPASRASGPPSRPPPPSFNAVRDRSMKVSSRSTVYKTVVVEDREESSHHDNSTFHQSFSLVNVTMDTDQDMKMTLTRSASVDDLLFTESLDEGDSASNSSNDAQTPAFPDGSSLFTSSQGHHTSLITPAASATVSQGDHSSTDSPQLRRKDLVSDKLITTSNSPQSQRRKDFVSDKLITTTDSPQLRRRKDHVSDQLITATDRLTTSGGNRSRPAAISDGLVTKGQLITGSGANDHWSEAPPVPARRSGGGGERGDEEVPSQTSPLRPPPIPRPRKMPAKKEEVKGDNSPPPPLPPKPRLQTDKPLIQFESTEEDADQFDPLMSKETSAGKQNTRGPHDPQCKDASSLGLIPGAQAAFLRSATYRKAMADRPVYLDDPESGSTSTAARQDRSVTQSSNLDLLGHTTATSAKPQHNQSSSGFHKGRGVKEDVKEKDPLGELFQLDPLVSVFKASTVSADTSENSEVHSVEGMKQSVSTSHNKLSHPSAASRAVSSISGDDPFTQPTTTSTHPTSTPLPGSVSAPLRRPPLLPRPRPRQTASKSVLVETSSTSPHPSSSSTLPSRPAALPRPATSISQHSGPQKAWSPGESGAGAVRDLLGLDSSRAAEDSAHAWSKVSSTARERKPPQPLQRVSVAALTKQFGAVKAESGGGRFSSSPLQHPPRSGVQPPVSSGKQWETFE